MDEKLFKKLIIPVKKVRVGKGFFHWPASAILAGQNDSDVLAFKGLSKDLSKKGLSSRIINSPSLPPTVRIYRDNTIKGHESYQLIVGEKGIEIYASADAGSYYAIQTLRDMLAIGGQKLPFCRIEDEPDFARRGVYHDCSRGKVPKLSTLKAMVERLAHWKINELQLYIENVFTFKKHPDIGKGCSPFTAEEILSLQDYCRIHHIKLVGSLASFGHLEQILALPRYRKLAEMPGFRGFPGGTTLYPTDPGSIKLISELYSEFVPLFEAEDFNVCCDETMEIGIGRSKKTAERVGTGRVYLDFLLKIHRLCQKYGKRMNAWADIVLKYPQLLKELPKDIVLLNWEYEEKGANIGRTKEIAKAGMEFMVCPGTSSWQTHGSRLPNSMGNVANFAAAGQKYGAQGLLNTDWGDYGHRNLLGVSMHGFAHGAAHSWNGKAVDNEKFTENFCRQVFGQKTDKLAKAIRALGSTYKTCETKVINKSWLYSALVEPMHKENSQEQSPIDLMDARGLRKIVEQFSDESIWPKVPLIMDDFEHIAIDELKLAARMDYLASRRALAAKAIRAGETVKSMELRRISELMDDIAKDFKGLWMIRNKVSRLGDNMRLFKEAAKR